MSTHVTPQSTSWPSPPFKTPSKTGLYGIRPPVAANPLHAMPGGCREPRACDRPVGLSERSGERPIRMGACHTPLRPPRSATVIGQGCVARQSPPMTIGTRAVIVGAYGIHARVTGGGIASPHARYAPVAIVAVPRPCRAASVLPYGHPLPVATIVRRQPVAPPGSVIAGLEAIDRGVAYRRKRSTDLSRSGPTGVRPHQGQVHRPQNQPRPCNKQVERFDLMTRPQSLNQS